MQVLYFFCYEIPMQLLTGLYEALLSTALQQSICLRYNHNKGLGGPDFRSISGLRLLIFQFLLLINSF